MATEVKALVAIVRERPVEKTVYTEYYGPFDTRLLAREFKLPDGDPVVHRVIVNIHVVQP